MLLTQLPFLNFIFYSGSSCLSMNITSKACVCTKTYTQKARSIQMEYSLSQTANDECMLSTGRNTTKLADTRKLNETAITKLLERFNLGLAPVSVWVNESMSKCFSAY